MNQYEKIYKGIVHLLPGIGQAVPGDYFKLRAGGFMDLHVDVLSSGTGVKSGRRVMRIAMAHNYLQNGDVMADPDMEIRLYPNEKMAEALTFQQAHPPVFQEVYPQPGYMNPRLKKHLNAFLLQWLNNLKDQGHTMQAETTDAA